MVKYSLHNGVVYRTHDDQDDGLGKCMDSMGSTLQRATEVYVAYIPGTPGAGDVAISAVFATEESCRKFAASNVAEFEVRRVPVVRRGVGGPLNVLGTFTVANGNIEVEDDVINWKNVVLTRTVGDMPPGTQLDMVQLVGRTLVYYLKNNVEVGRETVSCS
jgi:hypothetical protein